MKKYLGISTLLVMLAMPAGFAFAHEGNTAAHHTTHSSLTVQTGVTAHTNGIGGTVNISGSTTPPGFTRQNENRNAEANITGELHATRVRGEGNANEQPARESFWEWLFSLPATTTVGEIRAELTASTTVHATTQTPAKTGFFGHLFGFFHTRN